MRYRAFHLLIPGPSLTWVSSKWKSASYYLIQAASLRNDLEVCLKGFQMKYWPCRGQNFTSRVHFTQNPSDLGHPPFGWSHDKGQELNRQRHNTVLLFPQRWSVCSKILLHCLPLDHSAVCMVLKCHEPWLQFSYCEVTDRKKHIKIKIILIDSEYKAKHSFSIACLVDC